MAQLDILAEKIRDRFEERNQARDETLRLSREIIRTCANSIRAAHRGEQDRARELQRAARDAVRQMRERLAEHPDIYTAGYVHDCQKEFAEACAFLAVVSGQDLPEPEELGVEYPAYLNGLGEAVGELRRHTLDVMRRGDLRQAEILLGTMDDIYDVLVTFDYPDALTGNLRRTTDAVRGITEKTRGELTTALRQQELRAALENTLAAMQPEERP